MDSPMIADELGLDPDIHRFVRTVTADASNYPDFHSVPYRDSRKWAEHIRAPWTEGGPRMAKTLDKTVPTRHGPVAIRIHRPTIRVCPVLVYLHGGGWTFFSINTHDRVMREYAANAGCCVVGIDYALSPESKYPVALEQIDDVIDYLGAQADELELDASRMAIGGDSAGANLGIATCIRLRDTNRRKSFRAMILNYGAFAIESSADACRRFGGEGYMLTCEEMASFWRNYMRHETDASDPLVCPIRARLEDLPPAFLCVAECDILAEQSIAMAKKLDHAGVPTRTVVYEGASHSFLEAVSQSELSRRALQDASDWLRAAL